MHSIYYTGWGNQSWTPFCQPLLRSWGFVSRKNGAFRLAAVPAVVLIKEGGGPQSSGVTPAANSSLRSSRIVQHHTKISKDLGVQ
jgi:hypothetical protein